MSTKPPALKTARGSDGETTEPQLTGEELHSSLSTATTSAVESAFRLLGNLSSTDVPRRRVMKLDGVVLAASRAVSASAFAVLASPPPPVVSTVGLQTICSPLGAGTAAAALLCRLAPVLGTEIDEEELTVAGEALSAAVAAVSTKARKPSQTEASVGREEGGPVLGGGGEGGRAQHRICGNPGGEEIGDRSDLGLALEALSALLVLSWSDACSLEAAAAVEGVVTDGRLAASVVTLWQREAAIAVGIERNVVETPSSDFGTVSSVSLAFLSSIASRPAGRQALVAAKVAPAVIDVAIRCRGGDIVGRPTVEFGCEPSLSLADRSELLRLLSVLCASPAHRAAVRASLVAYISRERGVTSAADGDESVSAIEAAIVRLQGGERATNDCRTGASRIALLLGVSPPPLPVGNPGKSSSSPAAKVERELIFDNTSLSPSPPPYTVVATATTTALPVRNINSNGSGNSGWGRNEIIDRAESSSINSEDLEEVLFPTATAVVASAVYSSEGRFTSGTARTSATAVEVSRPSRCNSPFFATAAVLANNINTPILSTQGGGEDARWGGGGGVSVSELCCMSELLHTGARESFFVCPQTVGRARKRCMP